MPTNSPAQPEHYDIFISYRTTRRPWVEVLAKNLQAEGYRVLVDAWELTAGDNFTRKIFSALKHSRYALWFYRVPLFVDYIAEDSPELKLQAELKRLIQQG